MSALLWIVLTVFILQSPLVALGTPGSLGTPPTYAPLELGLRPGFGQTERPLPVPGSAAITKSIWVPGLDAGFVPQGLTLGEGQILVAAYQGIDRNKGPSRVFRIDPESGMTTGEFTLPSYINHPGGLAYGGGGVLYIANFGSLTKIDLRRALADGHARNASLGIIRIDRRMGPSFLTFDGQYLWFGRYIRMGRPALYKLNPDLYFGHPEKDITPETVPPQFKISLRTQGAAFSPDGFLWLSQSSPDYGRLQEVDPRTGKVLREYRMPAGIEDLSFASDGSLWSASEAGAKRYLNWETFYPVVFRLDLAQLGKQ